MLDMNLVLKVLNNFSSKEMPRVAWIEIYQDGSGCICCLRPTGEHNKSDDFELLEWLNVESFLSIMYDLEQKILSEKVDDGL